MNSNKETETQICAFSPKEIIRGKIKKKSEFIKFCENTMVRSRRLMGRRNDAYRRASYRKEVKSLWTEFRRRIVGGAVTAAVVIALCITINQLQWSLGYEVIVDGQNIGMVTDKAAVYAAIDSVREDVRLYLGEDTTYEKTPLFVRRIVSGKDLANQEMLRNALLSGVDSMVECYGVYIDGVLAFGVSSDEAAELVFNKVMNNYAGETTDDMSVEFCEEVQVKKEYLSIAMLETPDEAVAVIDNEGGKPLLSVKTVQTVALTEPVPYEIKKIDDSEMYRGRTVVSQRGKDGEAQVMAVVTKVNGVETDKKVIKSETTIEPITQIEKVGTKTPPATTGSGTFMRPTYGSLTSRYGTRWNRQHQGIDIGGAHGSAIKAADGGVVVYAGWMDGYGNYVVIDHENGYKTAYGHCASISVQKGARVAKGEVIAKMGNTGRSTGTHLHFEVIKNGVHVNPLQYVGY